MLVAFGPLEWDKSKYNFSCTSVAVNCLPVADGWGPSPSLTIVSEALASAPRGVSLVRTSTGVYQIYVGLEAALNKLDTTSAPYAWEDVSRLAGGAYALPPGDNWCFTKYGQNLTAWQLADNPQYIDVDSGTDFADIPNAPVARFSWVAGDFLVAGYNASFPNRARWCSFGNFQAWDLQVRGAGLQDIVSGAEIQGGIGSDQGAIIFQRNQISSMVKTVNVSASFDFSNIPNPYRGTIAPYSIAATNSGLIFYVSEDGFYMGVEGQAIGAERVDRTFMNDEVDLDKLQEITSAVDPFNKIVWFNYQKIGGEKARLGYNWQLDRWCYADTNVSQIAALATPGLTWDALDSLYATIDDVDEPFDSRLFAGGRPTLAGFNSDFELGWFTGANEAVTLETADVHLIKGKDGVGQRAFLRQACLIGDCTDFTLSVGTSDVPGGTVTWHGPFSPDEANIVYFKDSRLTDSGGVSGLYHRFRLNIPFGAIWKVVTALECDAVQEGTR